MVASTPEIPHNLKLVKDEGRDVPVLDWLREMKVYAAAWGLPELAEAFTEIETDLVELAAAGLAVAHVCKHGAGPVELAVRTERLKNAIAKVGYPGGPA